MRLIPSLLLAVMLAACDTATTTPAAAPSAAPDPVEAQINNLSEPLRRTTFFRAIRDANFTCQQIVSATARGRTDGKPVWAVACEDGGQYLLTLQPGGVFFVSGVPQRPAGQ